MRRLAALAVAVGGALVAVAAWLTLGGPPPGFDLLGRVVAGLVGALAVLVALVVVHSFGDDDDALTADPPERPTLDRPLAGRDDAVSVESAAGAARAAGSVEEGVERARPALRETLVAVLTQAGAGPEAVRAVVDRGTWTDDPVAAAALSAHVDAPDRSRRRRLLDWLYPGRATRRRVGRATAAVAAVADERLPPVPGRGAPRPAPVARPSLADLRRAADGTLEAAVDPGAVGVTRDTPGDSTDGTDAVHGATPGANAARGSTDEPGAEEGEST